MISFSVIYQPQNFYCYAIDKKASNLFKQRFRQLASCFDNVLLPEEEVDVHSMGPGMPQAQMRIMSTLLQHPSWKYVIFMQASPLLCNRQFNKFRTMICQ